MAEDDKSKAPSQGLFAQIKQSFSHAPRTLGLVIRSSPKGSAALFALTLLASVVPLGIVYTGKVIMEAVVARRMRDAMVWVTVELALVAAQILVQRGLGLTRALIGARLGLDVNLTILEKARALPLASFEDPEFYDKLTRARREAGSRPISVVSESVQIIQNILTLAGYVAFLVRWSPLAVAALFAASIPAAVVEMRLSGAAFRMRNWRSPEARRMNYLEYLLANDEHAKEVKLLDLGPFLIERYRALGETFYREDKALAVRRAVYASLLSLLSSAAFYGAYALVAVAAVKGTLSLGDMVLYLLALRQGQQAFSSILTAVGGMVEDNLYMSNLFSFLAMGEAERDEASEEPANGEGAYGDGERGIRLEGLSFQYPGKDTFALDDINVFIPAGKSLAIVGHNGAGKSTLIKLLTRLYTPTKGRILLDGKDLGDYEDAELRARLSVVFQDFNQYQFSLRDNIGLGSLPDREDDARVLSAADLGGAAALAKSLPKGLDAQLGRWFKEGVELSGGQWQKIALSRAFMRRSADILVLDEPTAALDAEAEHAVFERFRTLTEGKTAILISHRFPTVRMADHILVIEQGKLLEQGTHDELVSAGGRYAALFDLQAKGYR